MDDDADADRPVTVYALFDPREPAAKRYVGSTTQRLGARLNAHAGDPNHYFKSKAMNKWVGEMTRDGVVPSIEVLSECVESNRILTEHRWITKLLAAGHNLLNVVETDRSPYATLNIPRKVFRDFREQVFTKHGEMRGKIGEEAAIAISERAEKLRIENEGGAE